MTQTSGFKSHYSLRDQLERASVSVSNNIAEGFERGTTPELLSFLYIARGSAGEVRSMLCLMERFPVFKDFKLQIPKLKSLAESCSRQLYAWAQTLQNSKDSVGQRHMTHQFQQHREREKSARAFQEKVMNMLPLNHPLRKAREENVR